MGGGNPSKKLINREVLINGGGGSEIPKNMGFLFLQLFLKENIGISLRVHCNDFFF